MKQAPSARQKVAAVLPFFAVSHAALAATSATEARPARSVSKAPLPWQQEDTTGGAWSGLLEKLSSTPKKKSQPVFANVQNV